jgi:hypothetical protein
LKSQRLAKISSDALGRKFLSFQNLYIWPNCTTTECRLTWTLGPAKCYRPDDVWQERDLNEQT